MAEEQHDAGSPADVDLGAEPGIGRETGEEDYPFAAVPGEAALEFFGRWLDQARYARVERAGIRYIHEADASNVVNHITADVGCFEPGWDRSGIGSSRPGLRRDDRADRARLAELGEAIDMLRGPGADGRGFARLRRAAMNVLVLHGVNLDMFGKRDRGMYGTITLAEIDARCWRSPRSWASRSSLPDQRRGRDLRADPRGARRRRRRRHQRGRMDALQLRDPRCPCHPQRADRRGAPVEHPRPRGVPPPLGHRRDRQGPDRGFRGGSYLLGLRAAVSAAGRGGSG